MGRRVSLEVGHDFVVIPLTYTAVEASSAVGLPDVRDHLSQAFAVAMLLCLEPDL